MDLLTGDFGPRVARSKGKMWLDVHGLSKKLVVAPSVESLEANRTATPMSPLEPCLRELAGRLVRSGERLPLVVGSHKEGAFRCSVAFWVGHDELVSVESLRVVKELVSNWDGNYPDPDQWRKAEAAATAKAAAVARSMLNHARKQQEAALRRQIAACRQRLLRELGRYLVCIEGSAADLNGVFHRQMSRDIAGARRLQLCRERLGGYPEWPPGLSQELETFYAGLSPGQRDARLLGSGVDAALDDPRWLSTSG
jgi:hypothetical protein